MKTISSAEDFIFRKFISPLTEEEKKVAIECRIELVHEHYMESMIEFAKMHVKAALLQASKQVTTKLKEDVQELSMNDEWTEIDKDSILNSYPLNLIK